MIGNIFLKKKFVNKSMLESIISFSSLYFLFSLNLFADFFKLFNIYASWIKIRASAYF